MIYCRYTQWICSCSGRRWYSLLYKTYYIIRCSCPGSIRSNVFSRSTRILILLVEDPYQPSLYSVPHCLWQGQTHLMVKQISPRDLEKWWKVDRVNPCITNNSLCKIPALWQYWYYSRNIRNIQKLTVVVETHLKEHMLVRSEFICARQKTKKYTTHPWSFGKSSAEVSDCRNYQMLFPRRCMA